MSLIGTDGNGHLSFLHDVNDFLYDGSVYVHIAFEMIVFIKIPELVTPDAAQIQMVDAFAEQPYHGGQIIVCPPW
jgi:hypothetical protein